MTLLVIKTTSCFLASPSSCTVIFNVQWSIIQTYFGRFRVWLRAVNVSKITTVTCNSYSIVYRNGTLSLILTKGIPSKLFSFWALDINCLINARFFIASDIVRGTTIVSIVLTKLFVISAIAIARISSAFVTTNVACNVSNEPLVHIFYCLLIIASRKKSIVTSSVP